MDISEVAMNASWITKDLLLLLVALTLQAGPFAEERRPAPRFDGRSIPDPPQQKEPWTPPQTKLPRFLVSATTALFEQGMADPRGCEYRDVEVGESHIIKTRGFVLPRREVDAGRFVVSWDGVVYPALSVGALADLKEDIRGPAESMKRDRAGAVTKGRGRAGEGGAFIGGGRSEWRGDGPSGVETRSALKLCLLLRLGRADLAEALFAAATNWTPEVRGRDVTDYHITYLTLATEWAVTVYYRLIDAHMRGDDAVALDAARRLSTFVKAVDAKAAAMGFEKLQDRFSGAHPAYMPFLRQLPELLADQERRAREPARGPIPKRGGDSSARIAAMIRDLDQIDKRTVGMYGPMGTPERSPLVQALVNEGQPAVEPLLAALETDMRLTRSVTIGGRFESIERKVHSVFEAGLAAIERILNTNEFENAQYSVQLNDLAGRKKIAQTLRAFWEKNRAISVTERWYRTLRDDSAGRDEWFQAAVGIVQARDDPGLPQVYGTFVHPSQLPQPGRPMKGEELRSRRDPSVSELVARRILEVARAGGTRTTPDSVLPWPCAVALQFDRWDPKAALPVIRELMARAREASARNHDDGYQPDHKLDDFVAKAAVIRTRGGEREALDVYAADIRKSDPERAESYELTRFEPLWTYPDDPAIRDAAHWLFNDPQSPWTSFIRDPENRQMSWLYNDRFYTSPLLRSGGFREALIDVLGNKAAMGTVQRNQQTVIQYKTKRGGGGGFSSNKADMEAVKSEVDSPFRVCDYLAWRISTLGGAPEFEMYWPEDRRDRAVESCAAFLKRYGDRFTTDPLPIEPDINDRTPHLAFPALGRPATLDDVRQARAIFSLEGQGETRLIKVPGMPIPARWVALKDIPLSIQKPDGTTHREYEQGGWIWQAEEVRKADCWERFYGFVGPHGIARVPAAEIEVSSVRGGPRWIALPGGLDAWLQSDKPSRIAYEPDQPIRVVLGLRNRRGVENTAPTEFLRRGDDGRPALRRGVTLAVSYSVPRSQDELFSDHPQDTLKPKRTDAFVPGEATRSLAPFEAFEAMQLDLNDWFDLTRTGSYYVQVKFAADSGVGEGTSNDWSFSISDPDRVKP